MTPHVRDAEVGDAEAFARVRHASWQVAYRGLFPDEQLDALDLDESIDRFARAFATPPQPGYHRLVSVDEDDRVVAIANAGHAIEPPEDVTGQLYLIYAHPDVWGEGHGHALLEEVHRRLAADGHTRAMLYVAEGNDRTIRWYEAHGWRLDGTTQRDRIGDIDVVEARMVRDLTRMTGVIRDP